MSPRTARGFVARSLATVRYRRRYLRRRYVTLYALDIPATPCACHQTTLDLASPPLLARVTRQPLTWLDNVTRPTAAYYLLCILSSYNTIEPHSLSCPCSELLPGNANGLCSDQVARVEVLPFS